MTSSSSANKPVFQAFAAAASAVIVFSVAALYLTAPTKVEKAHKEAKQQEIEQRRAKAAAEYKLVPEKFSELARMTAADKMSEQQCISANLRVISLNLSLIQTELADLTQSENRRIRSVEVAQADTIKRDELSKKIDKLCL